MNRAREGAGALFFVMLVLATACFQEIERPQAIAAPTSATNEPSPSPTTPPTSTPTLIPTNTPSPTLEPTATPEPTVTMAVLEPSVTAEPPTAEPSPTDTPSPTATSVPEPTFTATATATLRPTSTLTPVPSPGGTLFLEVLGPIDEQTVQDNSILVYGLTNPGAMVRINQATVTADGEGQFQRIILLEEGTNVIEISASNGSGAEERRTLTVTRLRIQPFILIVTTPEHLSVVGDSPIRLIGVTSAQAIVSVNGVTVNVNLGGVFEAEVILKPEELNNIDVIATNIDGAVKSTRISVFYRPRES